MTPRARKERALEKLLNEYLSTGKKFLLDVAAIRADASAVLGEQVKSKPEADVIEIDRFARIALHVNGDFGVFEVRLSAEGQTVEMTYGKGRFQNAAKSICQGVQKSLEKLQPVSEACNQSPFSESVFCTS